MGGKGGSVIPWWAIFLPWNFRESVNWRNFFRESVIQKSSAIRETQKYFPWKRDSVKFLPWIRDSDIFRDSWNAKKLFHGKTPFELIVYQLKKTQILKRVKRKYEREHEQFWINPRVAYNYRSAYLRFSSGAHLDGGGVYPRPPNAMNICALQKDKKGICSSKSLSVCPWGHICGARWRVNLCFWVCVYVGMGVCVWVWSSFCCYATITLNVAFVSTL